MRILHIVMAMTLGACASSLPTRDRLTEANLQIQHAEQVGADKVPSAQYHLSSAKDAVEVAREQLERGNVRSADSMLDRVEADADLAVQLVREEKGRAATRREAEQLEQLKQGK